MTERWTYVSGEWVPEAHAKISIYDSQFMYGDAVFEMHRTFQHKHFLLDEHIDRLWASMRFMRIPITKTKDEVKSICDEAIVRNRFARDEEYRFMINVSRGPLGIYREVFELDRGSQWNEPTWIVNVWPLSKTTSRLAHFFNEPADARVTVQRQVPAQFIEAKVKNRSRMHYALADLEMQQLQPDVRKKAIPLLLDDDGFVCESTGANFMIAKDGELIVPERRNMLRGCSMQFVIEKLAPACRIQVVEKNFEPYDILEADEAFFLGTFYNIIPCDKLNGVKFGKVGYWGDYGFKQIGSRIVSEWNRVVRRMTDDDNFNLVTQIKKWGEQHVEA